MESEQQRPQPPQEQQQQPEVVTDLVTLIAVELNRFSELVYGTVGELQRDALPSSVTGEEIIAPPSRTYDAAARAAGFSKDLVGCAARLRELVAQLPQAPSDPSPQLARIRDLQALNQDLSYQLLQHRELAATKLQQAQDLYAALAIHSQPK